MAGKALTQYDERFAAKGEEYAGGERVGGDFLSTQGGVLTFDGEALPGNQMIVVILDVVKERTFYAEKYDPSAEHSKPPVCYAFSRLTEPEDEMAPHPSMQADLTYFQPQNDICLTCPNNEWGSSDTGKGKACSERRRMALLPAGFYAKKPGTKGEYEASIMDEIEHYETADIAYLKIPVMSVKDYARYVIQLNSTHRRPPFGAITRVYIEPDPKSSFRVKFEVLELLPEELFDVIFARHEEAKQNIIFGYPPPSNEAREGSGKGKIRR